jgi:hypothetical protein
MRGFTENFVQIDFQGTERSEKVTSAYLAFVKMSGSSCGEDRLDENKIGSQREREREVLLIVTCLFKGPCFATELLATSSVFVFLELKCTSVIKL